MELWLYFFLKKKERLCVRDTGEIILTLKFDLKYFSPKNSWRRTDLTNDSQNIGNRLRWVMSKW